MGGEKVARVILGKMSQIGLLDADIRRREVLGLDAARDVRGGEHGSFWLVRCFVAGT